MIKNVAHSPFTIFSKIVICFLLGINLFAQDGFLEAGSLNFKKEESHWKFTMDLWQFDYISDVNFDGQYLDIDKDELYFIPGASLTFGREFSFKNGLGSILSLTGIYSTLSMEEIGKASKDVDEDLIKFENNLNINMGKINLEFYYAFETKYFEIRPLLGASYGQGTIFQEVSYSYDKTLEKYKLNDQQQFSLLSSYLGVMFVNKLGLLTEIKYGVNNYSVSKRTQKGSQLVGSSTEGTLEIDYEEDDTEEYSYNFVSLAFGILY